MTVPNKQKGFSLVEMLVVLGIFVILTTLVLTSNSTFKETVTLDSIAYEVALSIQEAQVYGVAVSEVEGVSFDTIRGVDVNITTPQKYFFSADTSGDLRLTVDDLRVTQFNIPDSYRIAQICGSIDDQVCEDDTQQVSIMFKRPAPEAILRRGNNVYWVYAEIHIQSDSGNERIVAVTSDGQISVK